jgi:hypothetical protein
MRGIDDILWQERNNDLTDDGTVVYDTTYYHLTDVIGSTVVLMDDSAKLIERIDYTPYGEAAARTPGDLDGDGETSSAERSIINALAVAGTTITDSTYIVEADLDRDGDIDATDYQLTGGAKGGGDGGGTIRTSQGRLSTVDNIIGSQFRLSSTATRFSLPP